MIKVTFLTGEYPPMQGGIADYTAHLARHLAPLGVESSILTGRRWQKAQTLEVSETSKVLTHSPAPMPPPRPELGTKAQDEACSPAPVHPSVPNWSWRCWPAVTNFLKTHRPDVLHIQYQAAAFDLGGWVNWLPWYLKRRGVACRVVTTFHDLRVPYIFPKAGPFRWRSVLALARHSDAIICTNREDLQTLQVHLPITGNQYQISQSPLHQTSSSGLKSEIRQRRAERNLKSKILTHIPLGSNVEPQPPADFDRQRWREKYGANTGTLLLAYFGFLNESKGGEELIESLALLRQQGLDARLLVIGGQVGHADPTNVAYAQRVQALIDRYALADFVYCTGYVELPEVSANLLAADVVVMPYRDGVSFRRTTLIAALRHGCPVVSTTPAGPATVPAIRPGQNMLLAPPRQATALAQTVARLAGNVDLRQKLAAGARQLGDLFDWEKIAGETARLYRAVIGHR